MAVMDHVLHRLVKQFWIKPKVVENNSCLPKLKELEKELSDSPEESRKVEPICQKRPMDG